MREERLESEEWGFAVEGLVPFFPRVSLYDSVVSTWFRINACWYLNLVVALNVSHFCISPIKIYVTGVPSINRRSGHGCNRQVH